MSGPAKASKNAAKNAYRRKQQKARKAQQTEKVEETPSELPETSRDDPTSAPDAENGAAVTETASGAAPVAPVNGEESIDEIDLDDPQWAEFKNVLQKFQAPSASEVEKAENKAGEVIYDSDDNIQDEEEEAETFRKISKRAKKEMAKLSIAELKAMVVKPELVEWTDVSSSDPRLLVSIKAQRNIIPVPNHWSLKREYLSSKRGIEKPPFALPKFIAETGIQEMRDAALEKQAEMTLKQRQRERVQGKLGKLDIDYEKLHNAFFRRQTKPEMTKYGEVYYEGKEYETNLKHLRPGELSDELKDALGMMPGAPPPWLINQQRFGPPPSYPGIRVPGVNAPIPPGASWGFSPGQYGKPPVDDNQRPMWGGDLFGTAIQDQLPQVPANMGEPVERGMWGHLHAEGESDVEEEESEEEEEEVDDETADVDASGTATSMSGMRSHAPSEVGGTESIAGEFTLRKQRKGTDSELPAPPGANRSLYQVIPEQASKNQGFMGSERTYNINAAKADQFGESRKRKAGDIEVSVDVDALGEDGRLDKEALGKQYDERKKAESGQAGWTAIDQDDLSAMIASERRKKQKREEDKRKHH